MTSSFKVEVDEIPSAGYRWSVVEQHNCSYVDYRSHANTHDGELLVGGKSTIQYEITPFASGEYKFVIVYGRPWDDWDIPLQTIEIKGST